jgi:hypothetical protein
VTIASIGPIRRRKSRSHTLRMSLLNTIVP